jgi:hypothetical protein
METDTSVLQRLGWLLDATGWAEKTPALANCLHQRRHVWQPLRTDAPRNGDRNAHWHIIVNAEVEAEA